MVKETLFYKDIKKKDEGKDDKHIGKLIMKEPEITGVH